MEPQFIFEDSPTCLNFRGADNPRLCSVCLLARFVPSDCLAEKIPCRDIPLNNAGVLTFSVP